MAHATRELLLQTHLPQHRQRVTNQFAECLVNAVRCTPGNGKAVCEHMQHYLLFDRVLLADVQEVNPPVFDAIQRAWARAYPKRCTCTVRALSSSQVEVMCPVNLAAAMVLKPSASRHSWMSLLPQMLAMISLAYSINVKFLNPYTDWLTSQHSGVCYYIFIPLMWSMAALGM